MLYITNIQTRPYMIIEDQLRMQVVALVGTKSH